MDANEGRSDVSTPTSAMALCSDDEQPPEGEQDSAIWPLWEKNSESREKLLLELLACAVIWQGI
jgi:hypothetical protein